MGRAPCCDRDGLKKGPWLPEEDQKLIDYIEKHGPGNWRTLPKKAGLERCGKSCRLRWTNYLRPDIKRGRFSFEEEETIIQLHSILGNKWSAIAAKLPGRTDNEIKNYWNTHIRKRLLRMGIDPVTHTRRLDLLDLSSFLNTSQQQNSSSNQLNLLKLLSLQTLVNPELIKLATLLSSTHQNSNLNFLLQNQQANHQIPNNPIQSITHNTPQIQNPVQNSLNLPSSSCVPGVGDAQTVQTNLVQYPPEISSDFTNAQNFSSQTQPSSMLNNQSQSNVFLGSQSYGNIEQNQNQLSQFLSEDDQALINSLFDNNNMNLGGFDQYSDNSNQTSLSSSQQTPMSSNSMYPNSSSEDEIDSYCRNLLNLDIPAELFDI